MKIDDAKKIKISEVDYIGVAERNQNYVFQFMCRGKKLNANIKRADIDRVPVNDLEHAIIGAMGHYLGGR